MGLKVAPKKDTRRADSALKRAARSFALSHEVYLDGDGSRDLNPKFLGFFQKLGLQRDDKNPATKFFFCHSIGQGAPCEQYNQQCANDRTEGDLRLNGLCHPRQAIYYS
jgi:hypothetical protein